MDRRRFLLTLLPVVGAAGCVGTGARANDGLVPVASQSRGAQRAQVLSSTGKEPGEFLSQMMERSRDRREQRAKDRRRRRQARARARRRRR